VAARVDQPASLSRDRFDLSVMGSPGDETGTERKNTNYGTSN
jgi:hypothetical protein